MKEETLREWFRGSDDVRIVRLSPGGKEHTVIAAYCEGMVDARMIDEVALPRVEETFRDARDVSTFPALLRSRLEGEALDADSGREAIARKLFSGVMILSFPDMPFLFGANVSSVPQRKPEESSTEISIKGPRDAFTEDAVVNAALVRKRLKTASLRVEKFEVGRRSGTNVSLLYIADIANAGIVETVRRRIRSIDVDGIVGVAQLEEGLSGHATSLVPLLDYAGRPDFVAEALLAGRFAVVADGTPMALIGPANLTMLLMSPEDAHLPFYYVALERVLRILGLLLAVFLPGFWVSVSAYNLDQIPFPLLATITTARLGLPLSGPMDLFLMLGMFEVFREAGVRLPKAVGQTVAVVGGLIIGDAAIRAGITSPTTLVVTAISTVATFTLINQTLVGSVSLLRIGVLAISSVFGMYGLISASLGLLLYLASRESFGVPYLSPLSPPGGKDIPQNVLSKPWRRRERRPQYIDPNDPTRSGGEGSA